MRIYLGQGMDFLSATRFYFAVLGRHLVLLPTNVNQENRDKFTDKEDIFQHLIGSRPALFQAQAETNYMPVLR